MITRVDRFPPTPLLLKRYPHLFNNFANKEKYINNCIRNKMLGTEIFYFICQVDKQKQFIILCGNITYVTVSNFLDDFFHPAREDVNCEVLILNKMSPDLEFEGLLKRRKTQVQYFQVNNQIC